MEKFAKRPISYNSKDVDYLTSLGFDTEFAQLLSSRGVTKANSTEYLDDNYFFMHDPFKMTNMGKAVDIVKKAMIDGKKILIYGDYDADGLTASAILKLFFNRNGIQCDVFIPTREDGYGLHFDLVSQRYLEDPFDLLITVDCGISNKDEINEIKNNLDVEIIVTDHHEMPVDLPDCICVNCKSGYPFEYLSGAGVALKLVEALSDRNTALHYCDLATIGTIADMMPLADENRYIVKYGLKNMQHRGLLKLAEVTKCDKNLTASATALKICPKINSAGRVGVPYKALDLLLMGDRATLQVVNELIDCNTLRQNLLEKVIYEANLQLQNIDFSKEKMLFFVSDDWPKGILGIGANRFKETFKMPVAFLTKEGDYYVGSARGNDEINLYELFLSISDKLTRFGGHKGSVGFSVKQENLATLQQAINEKLCNIQGKRVQTYFDLHFSEYWLKKENYEKLAILEPYLPNEKPVFYIEDFCVVAGTFGNGNLKFTLNCGLELKAFGNTFLQYLRALKSGAECRVCFHLETDKYTNKIFGSLIDIELKNSLKFDDIYACNFLLRAVSSNLKSQKTIDLTQAQNLLKGNNVIAVFNSFLEYERAQEFLDFRDFTLDFFCQKNYSDKAVIISPDKLEVLNKYKQILVFCDYDDFYLNFGANAKYVEFKLETPTFLNDINIDRKVCAEVFNAISTCNMKYYDTHTFFENQFFYCDRRQYYTAIAVFRQLGLIDLDKENIVNIFNDKKNLIDSDLFRRFSK